jgi:hypothetical protein
MFILKEKQDEVAVKGLGRCLVSIASYILWLMEEMASR